MKISPINHQQNIAFKGTVDKSVIKYLKEVKKASINSEFKSHFYRTFPVNKDTYDNFNTLLNSILPRLKKYMARTRPTTKLVLIEQNTKRGHERVPVFVNTMLNSKIKGFRDYPSSIGQKGLQGTDIILPSPELPTKYYYGSSSKRQHNICEIERFATWVKNIEKEVNPKALDDALFEKRVQDITRKAKKTAPGFKFINKYRFAKTDKLAPQYNKEPIYMKTFNKIQKEAIKKKLMLED